MPTARSYASGTLTLLASPYSVASGTLLETLTAPAAPGIASGTLDEDESVGAAFDVTQSGVTGGRKRVTGARVLIADEAITTLTDTLSIESNLGNVIRLATFTVADPRVAYFHPTSLSNGEKTCKIYLRAGRPGNVLEWLAFDGKIESAVNQGANRPRATFNAIGNGAEWVKRVACLRAAAFSAYTTGQVIAEYAAAIGVTLTGDVASMGRKILRPIEVMKVPLDKLVERIGAVEGWTFRLNGDGSLEILSDEQLASGPVLLAFDTATNAIAISETPPSKPTTCWTMTSTQVLPDEQAPESSGQTTVTLIQGGFDTDGKPFQVVNEITSEFGAVIFTRVRQYAWQAPDGAPALPAGFYELTRVETRYDWQRNDFPDGSSRYTTRLNSLHTESFALGGVPCADDYSGTVYTWDGGGFFTTAAPYMVLTSRRTEIYQWNTAPCGLKLAQVTDETLFSPLIAPASGHLYSDGKYRAADHYTLIPTETRVVRYDDHRTEEVIPQVHKTDLVSRYIVSGHVAAGGGFPEQDVEAFRDAEKIVESWIGDGSGSGGTHTKTTIWPQMASPDGKTLESISEPFSGAVPGPPTGSVEVPQLQQQVITATYDGTSQLPWSRVDGSEVMEWAESIDVLLWAIARRINHAMEPEWLVTSRDYPELDVGHCVTIKDPKRSMSTPVRGYVAKVIRDRNFVTGAGNMNVVVRAPIHPIALARPA